MPPLKLEVFETINPLQAGQTLVLDASAVEDVRLDAYEAGYSAGWEDAVAAGRDDQNRIGTELANNLQKLAFTFHEARTHVLTSVKPLVVQLSTRLLPELAQEVLAPVVRDTLMPLIDTLANAPIRIVLNPASRPAVEHLLSQVVGVPLVVEEETTLGEAQVYLRFGEVEHHIDLDQAIADIARAVHDFFEYAEKETDHG
jgi:flagellar biosynthesis/type III secretory pathway protein FliH